MFEPQDNHVQETQLCGEPGQLVEENQAADEKQKSPAEEFDGVQIFSKVFIERHEFADAQSREKKRDGQAGGVDGEEENAALNFVARGGDREHGREDGANAGSPAEGEGEAKQEAAPRGGLCGRTAEVHVAVEPAGQGGTEKADDGKRKEVKRTEAGEERSMAE